MAASFKSKVSGFLSSTKVKDVFPRVENIVTLDSKCKLYDGFLTILHSNVLSAPVWDASVSKYIGFLDIRDLVSFVVFVYDEQMVQDNSRLEDLIVHGVGQFKVKTTDGVTVSYLSRRHKFVTVHESDSLLSVTKLLADAQVHRVPVVDDTGKVINVISQSSIIGLLADKCAEGGSMQDADQALSSFPHLGNSPVLSVLKTESVINTFRLLEKRNLSGIALVDQSGKLVGTTTGKDLGLFLKNPTLASLNRPIFEHLQHIRSELIESKTPCISVFEKDKLSRAVSLLAATRVHRVFVVDNDENYKPIRIISITDIFKFLTQ